MPTEKRPQRNSSPLLPSRTQFKEAPGEGSHRSWPYWHLNLRHPAFRTLRNTFLLLISHSIYGILLLLLFSHSVMSCDSMDCSTPGFPVLHYLLEFAQTHVESLMPSNQLILCCPLLLLPSIFPSIRVFSNESALCIRWPEYWSFSHSPSNEYSGLISFRVDWFNVAVQGTLKSLLQHHSL